MRPWVLALVTAQGACGDNYALDVHVEHPAGVAVARTVVGVYESASLTCIDVAFSRIGSDELSAVLVAEQTVAADGATTGGLTGISRTDHKVIVARGYAGDGSWVTAGCQEVDAVGGRERVEIETKLTVNASLVGFDPAGNKSDPFLAILAVTDQSGKAVGGRRVAWTVYGPAGSMASSADTRLVDDGIWEPAKAACTTPNGFARIHPIPPNVVGGFAVQARAEWAIQPPPLFTNLTETALASTALAPPNNAQKYCAIKKRGAVQRLVCLDALVARQYAVALTTSGGAVQADLVADSAPQAHGAGTEIFAVVSVPRGDDRDVYAITTRGVISPLFADASTPAAVNGPPICPSNGACVTDVLVVPPCGPSLPGRLILHLDPTSPDRFVQLDARGGNKVPYPVDPRMFEAELDNAGCVHRLEPGGPGGTRQVVTFFVGTRGTLGELVPMSTLATYNCSPAACFQNQLVPAGVAFVPGSEPRMVASAIDATGVVLSQVVLAPDSMTEDRFIERERYPAASLADRMVVGKFDNDPTTDLFWTIGARRGTTFQVAYARQIGPSPLVALSPPETLTVSALDIGDLDGNGYDDIVVMAEELVSKGVAVIPVFATTPTPPLGPDSPCP